MQLLVIILIKFNVFVDNPLYNDIIKKKSKYIIYIHIKYTLITIIYYLFHLFILYYNYIFMRILNNTSYNLINT